MCNEPDHIRAVCEVLVQTTKQWASPRRRVCSYHRSAANDAKKKIFEIKFEELSLAPFEVEPETHAHIVSEKLGKMLGVVCPAVPREIRSDVLSDKTREAVIRKGKLRKQFTRLGHKIGQSALQWCAAQYGVLR